MATTSSSQSDVPARRGETNLFFVGVSADADPATVDVPTVTGTPDGTLILHGVNFSTLDNSITQAQAGTLSFGKENAVIVYNPANSLPISASVIYDVHFKEIVGWVGIYASQAALPTGQATDAIAFVSGNYWRNDAVSGWVNEGGNYAASGISVDVYSRITFSIIEGEGSTTSLVIPYSIVPLLSNGDDILSHVNGRSGLDPNGDGAYDDSLIISNTTAGSRDVAANDTVVFDALQIFQQPVRGSVSIAGTVLTYQPAVDSAGVDVVGYVLTLAGTPVAAASLYVGVYGSSVPSTLNPTFKPIPEIEAVMDTTTQINLDQYANLGVNPHTYNVVSVTGLSASVTGSVLSLSPNSTDHSLGLGQATLQMIATGGAVYDSVVVSIQKVDTASSIEVQFDLLVNDVVVDTWTDSAVRPQVISRTVNRTVSGIIHNNEPVSIKLKTSRLDGASTSNLSVSGTITVDEVVA